MFKYPRPGQGPPAPFVPSSQQQPQQQQQQQQQQQTQKGGRSKAIPIVAPSSDNPSSDAGSSIPSSSLSGTPSISHLSPQRHNANGSVGVGTSSNSTSPYVRSRRANNYNSNRHGNAAINNNDAMSPSSPSKAALSARAASAAVFVPKSVASPSIQSRVGAGGDHEGMEEGSGTARLMENLNLGGIADHHNPYANNESGRGTPNSLGIGGYETDGSNSLFDPTYMGPLPHGQEAATNQTGAIGPPTRSFNPYEHLNEYGDPTALSGNGTGMDYYGAGGRGGGSTKAGQPLQYHLYNPPLPHVSNLHPQHLSAHAFFMSADEREDLQRKNEAIHASAPPPELGGPNLPEELHVYHSLVSLEPSNISGMGLLPQLIDTRIVPPTAPGTVNQLTGALGEPSRVFGYRCHVYKALCTLDGKCYVLRRLENFRLNHEAAISLVERWRRIRHPSIISVREAFTTRAFGDSSIVFVYDYHPLATTLYAEHMVPKPPQPDRRTGRLQSRPMQIPERTLWSYLCQLANVIRCIHHHGMAARCIEPSKVLRTSKNRVRLNCCSIFDVIAYDPNANASTRQTQQSEDLVNLGKLLVSLSCNSMAAVQNMNKSLEHISRSYSQEYREIVLWLLSKSGDTPTQSPGIGHSSTSRSQNKNAEELVKMLGKNGKYAEEFESTLNQNDLLESNLLKELENARLVRLLCKFGFINERPEFDHDPRWSETGDRYIVKLFRDLVFHSVDEAGRPVVDLSHILTNLNKLDVGSEEKIMLTSRDEQSCLIVSYREIKNCIESAFQDLSRPR